MIQKKRKAGERQNYQSRAFSGYGSYRYGEVRPVYVPGKDKLPLVVTKDKHLHLVELASSILATGKPTKFEHEGSCRAGLRAGFCLAGNPWEQADAAAGKIVSDALHNIRARRPTWEQGQREVTDPNDRCSWCKGPIPDELFYRPTPARYCSDVCAKSAFEQRDFERRDSSNRAYRDAQNIIAAHRQPVRACLCCGTRFRSREPTQLYCSERCANRHRPQVQAFTCSCRCCGISFTATYENTSYCSPTCRSKFAMLASGAWQPKQLSPPVFDFLFTIPINASRPVWLTPERFDEMVAG